MNPRRALLFVCHANVCRSPLAEGLFRALVRENGCEDEFEIDSAGTCAIEGSAPHPYSVLAAAEIGVDVRGRARQIGIGDLARFDEILLMDRRNREELRTLAHPARFGPLEDHHARIRLLGEAGGGDGADVLDPVGGALVDYRRTRERLQADLARLFAELRAPA